MRETEQESVDDLLRHFVETCCAAVRKAVAEAVAPAVEELAAMGARIIQSIIEDGRLAEAVRAIMEAFRRKETPPNKKDAPRKIGRTRGAMGAARRIYRARSRI